MTSCPVELTWSVPLMRFNLICDLEIEQNRKSFLILHVRASCGFKYLSSATLLSRFGSIRLCRLLRNSIPVEGSYTRGAPCVTESVVKLNKKTILKTSAAKFKSVYRPAVDQKIKVHIYCGSPFKIRYFAILRIPAIADELQTVFKQKTTFLSPFSKVSNKWVQKTSITTTLQLHNLVHLRGMIT